MSPTRFRPSWARRAILAAVVLCAAGIGVRAEEGEKRAQPPAAAADVAKLLDQLATGDVPARRKAVYALWKLGAEAKTASGPLAVALLDADAYVRTTAAKALTKHAGNLDAVVATIAAALTKGAPDVRLDAAKLIQMAGPDTRPIAALVAALADPDPEVRANVAAALEWTGEAGRPAVERLSALVAEDEDDRVRMWAARALGSIDGARLVPLVIEDLASDDATVRAKAAATLGYGGRGAASASRALGRLLGDPDSAVRVAAANALGAVGPDDEIDRLLSALDDRDPAVRAAALAAMNFPGEKMRKALPRLAALLAAPDGATRAAAATAIASIDPVPAIARIVAMLRDDAEPTARVAAAFAVSNAGARLPDEHVPALVKALDDTDPTVRNVCVATLMRLGSRAAAAAPAMLRHAAATDDPFVRQFALLALPKLGVAADVAVPALVAALGAKESMVRSAAANALAEIGAPAVATGAGPLADRVLHDDAVDVRSAAALALGKLGPSARAAAAALVAVGDDAPYLVRVHAAYALAATAPDAAAEPVERLVALIGGDPFLGMVPVFDLGLLGPVARPAEARLVAMFRRDETPQVWHATALALCRIGGESAPEVLRAVIAAASASVPGPASVRRRNALLALGELPEHAATTLPVLVAALRDADPLTRNASVRALLQLGPAAAPAIPAIREAAKDGDPAVAQAARYVLEPR